MRYRTFSPLLADAAFPEKQQCVIILKGKSKKIRKNSWFQHLSLSYNERWNLVMRMTWTGYSFFATMALSVALLKG